MKCSHCDVEVSLPPAVMISVLYPSGTSAQATLHRQCFIDLASRDAWRVLDHVLNRVGFIQNPLYGINVKLAASESGDTR